MPACSASNSYNILETTNAQRIALRPQLNLPAGKSGPEETFQNDTLRPILKLQHPLLLQLFAAYVQKRKPRLMQMADNDRAEWIREVLRNDLRLRNQLCGMVMGMFTETEMQWFLDNEAEAMQRLASLLTQRVMSAY